MVGEREREGERDGQISEQRKERKKSEKGHTMTLRSRVVPLESADTSANHDYRKGDEV